MKIILTIFLSVFLVKSCDKELNAEMRKANIEYTAVSRGFYLNINIQDEKLLIVRKRDENAREYTLTKNDWKAIADLYKKIQIEKLPTYKDPTQKRFYDGAAIANLRVTYDGETYETQGFDHGNPPVEIEKFVNKIVSFATE